VGFDVVHLPDEKERRAEEDHAEQIEGFPYFRQPTGSLAQLEGAAVGGRDRAGEKSEAQTVAHRLPVRGEEADHADADGDGADQGECGHGPAPRLLAGGSSGIRISASEGVGLLGRDDAFRDPGLALPGELVGEGPRGHC
jgi:hypothetical protein